MFKLQNVWYSAFLVITVWYVYWIFYDIFVWNKLLAEVNVVNYVGMVVSLALLVSGSQINKLGKKEISRTKQASPKPEASPELVASPKPAVPIKSAGSGKEVTCPQHLGYLSQRSTKDDIPPECITCTKAIECITIRKTGK